MHGKTSPISHDGKTIFRGLSNPFEATRYHSLAVMSQNLPAELEVSATADDGEIMGIRHKTLPVEGVQFHPESFLTTEGAALLGNFLRGLQ
jgi:anthranilate synthase component 2/para-aminobenzoate synthetase component 2